jgi:hypothetical protein
MRLVSGVILAGTILAAGALPAFAGEAADAPVRIFDAGELTLDRYTVVERLWTGTWRAAFWVPTHDDAGSAIAALTSKAADLGADGVVNLHCINDAGGWGSGYYCYGLAIKLR